MARSAKSKTRKPVTVVVCRVGQNAVRETIENSLESFQKIVGGYIELVRLAPGIDLWVNEEGKYTQKPNLRAPLSPLFPHDVVFGDFFLASSRNGGMMSLSEANIAKCLADYERPDEPTDFLTDHVSVVFVGD